MITARLPAIYALAALMLCTPALAQNSDTNQDDPVRITKCAWLTTPLADDSVVILGSQWAGKGQDAEATRKKAAACVHLKPEALYKPTPCPGGVIGVMSDQHLTPCN